MKVVHICGDYFNTSIYRNLHRTLPKKGIESFFFVPTAISLSTYPAEENVFEKKSFNRNSRFFFFHKQRRIFSNLFEDIKNTKPDVLHSHFLFTNGYFAMKINQVLGIPYVVTVQNTDLNVFFRFMPHLRSTGSRVLLKSARIIFINEAYRDKVINYYCPEHYRNLLMGKSIIIPFGIDDFWLQNQYQKRGNISGRKLQILTVGDINKNKNQLTVAKATKVLIESGFDTLYTVVGEVKNKKVLHELKSLPYVKVIAQKPKEEILNIYREADIFVLPSITESFGLVYPEAMSQGLPVVYSKGQGFDGQFEEGTVGFHVESRNAKEIADRIVDITKNYQEISGNCVELSKRFNWGDISFEFEKVYRESLFAESTSQ